MPRNILDQNWFKFNKDGLQWQEGSLFGKNLTAEQVGQLYGVAGTAVGAAGDIFNDLSNQYYAENTGRTDLANTVSGNSWGDVFSNSDKLSQGLQTISALQKDYSGVKNNADLLNTWNSNDLQDEVHDSVEVGGVIGSTLSDTGKLAAAGSMFGPVGTIVGGAVGLLSGLGRGLISAFQHNNAEEELNNAIERANREQIGNFYTTAQNNQQRQQRQAMMNYFAEGGMLNEFNTGGSHEENPLGGIPQGIASDGLPNLVEEGEVRSDFDDAKIFNNKKKNYTITERDCEEYLLPKSVIGCNPAEAIKKLKKEYEDRVNDPIAIATMKEWDSRVFSYQEDKTAELEEKEFTKEFNKLPDDQKLALAQDALAQEQQEGIDLSQPMFAKGGKIYIKPKNRGKFNATKKRTGKTTEELTHSKNPLTRKRAIFAQNAKKWAHKHAIGDFLSIPPYGKYHPTGFGIDYVLGPDVERLPSVTQLMQQEPKIPQLNYNPIELENTITAANTENPAKEEASTKKKNKIKLNAEDLRYSPAVGAGLGALVSAIQPRDYSLANRYEELAGRYNPIAAPHLSGYRKYTPYDINLGDIENIGLEAQAIAANRGQNRATQGALNTAVIAKSQEAKAKRNLAMQQANEANRLAVDQYNLGIDQTNANITQAYDQLNQQILTNKLNLLANAAQARDASDAAWAQMFNTTHENFFNQLGNVGRDEWNRNQRNILLNEYGPEILKLFLKS